mgnify:CR=1 FL=1
MKKILKHEGSSQILEEAKILFYAIITLTSFDFEEVAGEVSCVVPLSLVIFVVAILFDNFDSLDS